MTVKELKKELEKMPDDYDIGYWDGDYSINNPCIAHRIKKDDKREKVIVVG